MMSKIKIAIAGLGNCASSLLQGIEYYRQIPEDGEESNGLMHYAIGPYRPFDIELVAAFDIDRRKVGRPAAEAIFAPPNNTLVFCPQIHHADLKVQMGPILDGFPLHMLDYPEHRRCVPAEQDPVDVAAVLRESGTEILVNYLPVGSQKATEFYAQAALDAGVAIDAIRLCKLALDQGISGPLLPASAYYMKHPPVQMRDLEAMEEIERFLAEAAGRNGLSAYKRPAAQPVVWPTGYQGTAEKARDTVV